MKKFNCIATIAVGLLLLTVFLYIYDRPARAIVIQVPTKLDAEFGRFTEASTAFIGATVRGSPGTELRMILISEPTNGQADSKMADIERELHEWHRNQMIELIEHDRVSGSWQVIKEKYFSPVPYFRYLNPRIRTSRAIQPLPAAQFR